jgi:hypothetical protein
MEVTVLGGEEVKDFVTIVLKISDKKHDDGVKKWSEIAIYGRPLIFLFTEKFCCDVTLERCLQNP